MVNGSSLRRPGRRDIRETRGIGEGTTFFLSGHDRYTPRWKKVAKRCTRIASLARETWHEIPAERKRHSLPLSFSLSPSRVTIRNSDQSGGIVVALRGANAVYIRIYMRACMYMCIYTLPRRTDEVSFFSHVGTRLSSFSLSVFWWFGSITVRTTIIRRKERKERKEGFTQERIFFKV